MLSVLLLILKIIGFILLGIIGLLLLVVLAVLFAPIRYKITADAKKPDIKAMGIAKWLLFVLRVRCDYKDNSIDTVIRIFGIPIKRFSKQVGNPDKVPDDRNIFEKILDKVMPISPELEEAIEEAINSDDEERELQFEPVVSRKIYEEDTDIFEEPTNTEVLDEIFKEYEERQSVKAETEKETDEIEEPALKKSLKERFIDFCKDVYGFISTIIQKIKDTKKSATEGAKKGARVAKEKAQTARDKFEQAIDFIEDEENIKAYELIKEKLFLLVRHYKPRKIKGELEFGLDDPATTGRILGIYYILFPAPNKRFRLTGNFKEDYYEGNILIKGRIRLNHLLLAAWKLYRNDRIKSFIKKED